MISRANNMKEDMNMLDISVLSEQAQQELMDFYHFLLERYGKKQQTLKKLPETFYHPVKTERYHRFDREEIYNGR